MVTARAVRIREPGGVEVLELGEIEVRDPAPGEVRVAVAAAGLNRADLLQRRGLYPAPAGVVADVPGLEYAGTVTDVGEGARLRPGDRVMGIVGGGAMATHLVVPERQTIPVPTGMDLAAAAAVPEVFLTAWDALVGTAGMALGDVVLIHAVGSGVGTAAIQLCLAAGARPVGTARTRDKLARCAALGLRDAIETSDGRFADRVMALTGGAGADVILDVVGGDYLDENLQALATGGRVVMLGLMGGPTGTLSLGALLAKRGRLIGSTLRSRPAEAKAALAQAFAHHVLPLFAGATLRPVIDAVLPMAEVRAAHERMERNATFGKLVLAW